MRDKKYKHSTMDRMLRFKNTGCLARLNDSKFSQIQRVFSQVYKRGNRALPRAILFI